MITIQRGNDISVQWTIKNLSGEAVDFTGCDISFAVRSKIKGAFPVIPTSTTSGVIRANVPGNTLPVGNFYLDVEWNKVISGRKVYWRARTEELIEVTNKAEDFKQTVTVTADTAIITQGYVPDESTFINKNELAQNTGDSTTIPMSQTAVTKELTGLDKKVILLTFWGTYNEAKTGTTKIGDTFYNTNTKKVYRRDSANDDTGNFTATLIDLPLNAICSYSGVAYVYDPKVGLLNQNGDDIAQVRDTLNHKLIRLTYVGTYDGAKTETSEIGDIYFNTKIKKLQKRLSISTPGSDFQAGDVESVEAAIYTYQNELYVINEQGDLVPSTEHIEELAIHNQNAINNYAIDTTKIYKDNGSGKIQEVGLSGFYTCRIPIKKGNKFFINSVGSGYDVYPYLISSEDLTIIQKPNNTVERYKGILEITQDNSAYLYVNCVNTYKDFAVRNYSDSTVLQQSESILIRRNWVLENGLFDEEGNFEDNVLCKRVKIKLSTQDDELIFLKVGKGYTMIINDINPTTNQKENFEIYNHCSYTTQGREICVGFKKNDGTAFDDWDNAGFLAYSFFPKNIHENYDITIAASDSDPIYKNKADIVCDGDNDQFIIQCAMYNVMRDQKVLLYPGNFYLSEYRVIPSTKDDLGQNAFLTFQQPFDQFKRILHVDGYMRGIVQSETTGQTNIWIKKTVWDTIGETWKNPVVVIGGEKRNFFLHTLMQLSCLNFRGYDAKKSVCYIDGYWMANMMIDKCNCKSAEPTFGNFTYIPNRYNIGIRGLQGSPYGTNYIKDSLCWRCGTGYDIGGEHFIVENSAAAFCGLGFAFSDFNGHIKMEHNNMLIKCVISQCMKSIRFGRYGYDEDTDIDSLSEEEQAKINSYQVIEIYGLQYGESVFKTEGMQSLGYEDGMHYTEGPYEVFPGTWKGIITSQGRIAPSKGCKQFEIRNLNYNIRGDFDSTTERPNYYNPESNLFGLKFWDDRTQKEYIVGQDGKWLDPARFAISAIKQIMFGDINLGEFEDGGFNGLGEDADTVTDIRTRSFFCCGYFTVEFPSSLKVVINATQVRSSKTNIVAQSDTRYSNTEGYIRILCRYADGSPRDANLYDLAKQINIKYVTVL